MVTESTCVEWYISVLSVGFGDSLPTERSALELPLTVILLTRLERKPSNFVHSLEMSLATYCVEPLISSSVCLSMCMPLLIIAFCSTSDILTLPASGSTRTPTFFM